MYLALGKNEIERSPSTLLVVKGLAGSPTSELEGLHLLACSVTDVLRSAGTRCTTRNSLKNDALEDPGPILILQGL
jgi:hypothetical protein